MNRKSRFREKHCAHLQAYRPICYPSYLDAAYSPQAQCEKVSCIMRYTETDAIHQYRVPLVQRQALFMTLYASVYKEAGI